MDTPQHTRNRYNSTTYIPALTDLEPSEYLPAPMGWRDTAQIPALMPTATTTVTLATTYTDRSRAWVIATTPLAATAAITAVLVAILGFAVPALSVAALTIFFMAFGAVWLLGWSAHLLIAPDGIALLTAVFMYRYVRHEQKHRHRHWGQR